MKEAVIVSGARTPIGRFGGSLKDVSASKLGATAIKGALKFSGINSEDVDEVVFGNSIQGAEAGYAARLSSLLAGLPKEVPSVAINKQCASGLEAINIAAQLIISNQADIVIAGGTESMSQSPFVKTYESRFGSESTNSDALINSISCPVNQYHMGVTAENLASKYKISRKAQDIYSLESQRRAVTAITDSKFKKQIVEVKISSESEAAFVNQDECPRPDSTLNKLSKLPPVFQENGTVTAGNSSVISDGAAAVVIMSLDKCKSLGIKPKLRWVSRGVAGVEPSLMGTGPVPALGKAILSAGLTLDDLDLIELNEAFASQSIYCIQELGLDMQKTNVNGSGISLGHPIGATGAVLVVKLMEEMNLNNHLFGGVSLCVGGGQGIASIFENVQI
ncbi:MAG: acetyl-CoA C-acyltransferase [Chloroflexi bacterium]|nr:acetyl-CoA C-acyltransferase [Chloroflexota bacterium]|tara:strand:- start:14632 stop:15807 length:1176 start_codon:yes stop_codon:yes gene_type:complete